MKIFTLPNTTERALYLFAGTMILVSVALTHWVHPSFIWFTVFIGANLIQNAFTGLCPATWVMRKLGMNSEREHVMKSD